MTRYSVGGLDAWAKKIKRRGDLIVRQSTNDAIVQASRTAAGVTRGGVVKKGFLPVMDGFLAASLVSSLNGGSMLDGKTSYVFVVAGMEAGDVASFGWTAAHARPMHYGYTSSTGKRVGGWMWVDEVANDWPRIVARNVKRAMARTR